MVKDFVFFVAFVVKKCRLQTISAKVILEIKSYFRGNFPTMKAKEVKRRLIEKIEQINDPKILDEVNRLLNFDVDKSDLLILSTDQTNAVEEGRSHYFSGKVKSDDQLNEEIDEWLKK